MKARLLRGVAIGAVITGILATVVTPVASMALIATFLVTGLVNITQLPFPFPAAYCWWIYAWYYGLDPRFTTKLILTEGVPIMVLWIPIGINLYRRRPRRLTPARPGQEVTDPDRAPSRLHGDARWMTMDEAKELFPGPHPSWGGIPVGEAYRPDQDDNKRPFVEDDPATWGQGGKAPLLITPLTSGATSGIIIGGSGSYKTMAFSVPALATHRGSIVAMDPSQQVGRMVRAMREAMGHQVVLIDPTMPDSGSFNPLACIDLEHPLAPMHLSEFIDWCSGAKPETEEDKGGGNEKYFADQGRQLQACVLADMLWDTNLAPERKTLTEWRSRLITPEKEMPKLLMSIYANSKVAFAREIAGTLMAVHPRTFTGIYTRATGDTSFLSTPAYAKMLSGNSFDPRTLTGGKLTVIVQISDGDMQTTPAVGRIIIGCLARVMLRANGQTKTPVPFILDEMDNLKFMPILQVLRDQGRKSGVPLFPMWQSTGQIEKTWGRDGKRSWYASAAWRLYASVNDEETAREVSKRCGSYTVLARTEGVSTSRQNPFSGGSWSRGTNDNTTEQAHPLLSEYEVQTALRPDEAIIIPRGKPALRCGRPLYWRRPEMKALIERDVYRQAAE